MSNRADIFTLSPSSFRDLDSVHAIPGLNTFGTILQVVLNGILSRAQQYWFVKQSASLGGWWTGVLGAANTVYFPLAGTLFSISGCARMEAVVDTRILR